MQHDLTKQKDGKGQKKVNKQTKEKGINIIGEEGEGIERT